MKVDPLLRQLLWSLGQQLISEYILWIIHKICICSIPLDIRRCLSAHMGVCFCTCACAVLFVLFGQEVGLQIL